MLATLDNNPWDPSKVFIFLLLLNQSICQQNFLTLVLKNEQKVMLMILPKRQ